MAATQIKKPSATIGVDKYTFWELKTDTAAGAEYGDAYSFPGTVQITPTDAGGSTTFDADNRAYETVTYVEKIGHDLESADIPPEVEGLWRGAKVDEFGGVTYGSDMKQKYFGVAWRIEKPTFYRYVRCYKGSYSFASNTGGKTKPSSGAPEYQTAKASYTAVARDYDDAVYYILDDRDMTDEQKKEIAEKWFEDMDWKPTKAAE